MCWLLLKINKSSDGFYDLPKARQLTISKREEKET
jgi:hypothetical protein